MPIFVVGFPRSGTTLCQRLVSAHLGLPTLPETHFFERLESYDPVRGHLQPERARGLIHELSDYLDFRPGEFDPLLAGKKVRIRTLFQAIVAGQIGDEALAKKGVWVEKTPDHVLHLDRIRQIFPRARFVCMVRNPLQALASRRELMEPGKGWGEAWLPIEVLCRMWSLAWQKVHDFQQHHGDQLLTVQLESLSRQPDVELARIAEFAGAVRPVRTAPVVAEQKVIQPFETWKAAALGPVDAALADRSGRSGLDAHETWRVQALLGEAMQALGYPLAPVPEPAMDELHRRMLATIEWYRLDAAKKDEQMNVKSGRIRRLLVKLQAPHPTPPAEKTATGAADIPTPSE